MKTEVTYEQLQLLRETDLSMFDEYMEVLRQLAIAEKKNPNIIELEKEQMNEAMDSKTEEQIAAFPKEMQTDAIRQTLCELNRLASCFTQPESQMQLSRIRNHFFEGICDCLDYYGKGIQKDEVVANEQYPYTEYLEQMTEVRPELVHLCIKHKVPTNLFTTLIATKQYQEEKINHCFPRTEETYPQKK